MGKVSVNGSTVALKGPSKLVWFRRMTAQIGTHDKNETCSPQCDFYGIGVENESGRFGFHITPDEQLREGIPA